MRLIQFNSGLCVVLKDVQHYQTEQSQEYYLTKPSPAHHSSDSSITTTDSSVKSNGINHEYYIPTIHHKVKTPIVPSTIVVEVGMINTS